MKQSPAHAANRCTAQPAKHAHSTGQYRSIATFLTPLIATATAVLIFVLSLVSPLPPMQPRTEASSSHTEPTPVSTVPTHATKTAAAVPAVTVDWHNPTGGTQPDLTGKNNLTVDVDLAAQEATISDANGSPLYTMLISSGMNDATPHGTFTIGQRGLSFYTPSEGMGAKWWTSFLGTGYLFHSVPTNANGDYIASEGAKLGNAASHGCVRLSIADAQWFYDQIPSGTRVHIH